MRIRENGRCFTSPVFSKNVWQRTLIFPDVGPIANKYGPKCFAAGTLVLTAGGYKKIEEIEVGDKVLAYDEETGKQGYKEVVRLFRNTTEEWYHIHVNGEDIKCTGGHPFYVASQERFISARELEVEIPYCFTQAVVV